MYTCNTTFKLVPYQKDAVAGYLASKDANFLPQKLKYLIGIVPDANFLEVLTAGLNELANFPVPCMQFRNLSVSKKRKEEREYSLFVSVGAFVVSRRPSYRGGSCYVDCSCAIPRVSNSHVPLFLIRYRCFLPCNDCAAPCLITAHHSSFLGSGLPLAISHCGMSHYCCSGLIKVLDQVTGLIKPKA